MIGDVDVIRDMEQEEIEYQANWLNSYSWSWWAMLSFRHRLTTAEAWHRFNHWRIAIQKQSGNKISYFMAMELKRHNPHLHVLLSGTAHEKIYYWEKEWFSVGGVARIVPYDPRGGANYYLAKKFLDDRVVIKQSKDLPEKVQGEDIEDEDVGDEGIGGQDAVHEDVKYDDIFSDDMPPP